MLIQMIIGEGVSLHLHVEISPACRVYTCVPQSISERLARSLFSCLPHSSLNHRPAYSSASQSISPLTLPSTTMVSAMLLSPLLTLMLAATTTAFSAPTTAKADIAVVGCGVLGTSLCKQLLSHPDFASRSITAITKSTARHDDIRKQVLQTDGDSDRFVVKTLEDVLETASSFQDVVFCAPPSGFDNYPSAVKEAAEKLWAADKSGSFVFTSSGGVYEGKDGETVTESCPTLDPETNPRSGRMIYAEQEAIAKGGCALRLAGLYTLERGAHSYWLKRCQETGVQGREDGIVNL